MKTQDDHTKDLEPLLAQIGSAFSDLKPPPLCHDILTQKDFERAFMGAELPNTIHHLYDYDEDEIHYLTPFLMRGYLDHYGKDWRVDDDLSFYLFWFSGFGHESEFIRTRYLSFYSRFDSEQRKCICSFLSFLRSHCMDDGYLDEEVLKYWCAEFLI